MSFLEDSFGKDLDHDDLVVELMTVRQAERFDLDAIMANWEGHVEVKDRMGATLGFVSELYRETRVGPLRGVLTGLTAAAREILDSPHGYNLTPELYLNYQDKGPKLRAVALMAKPHTDPIGKPLAQTYRCTRGHEWAADPSLPPNSRGAGSMFPGGLHFCGRCLNEYMLEQGIGTVEPKEESA